MSIYLEMIIPDDKTNDEIDKLLNKLNITIKL